MILKLKFIKATKPRRKTTEVEIQLSNTGVTLTHLKQLWTIEQLLNSLPQTDTRVHVEVENELDVKR